MDFSIRVPVSVAVVLSLLLLTSPSLVFGQAGASRNAVTPEVLDPSSVDDATLRQTAKAFVKVSSIIHNGKQAFDNASDESQKQQIKEQVAEQKLATVKAEGLQPQKFNQVLKLVMVDKPLRQKFLTYVKDAKNSAPGASGNAP